MQREEHMCGLNEFEYMLKAFLQVPLIQTFLEQAGGRRRANMVGWKSTDAAEDDNDVHVCANNSQICMVNVDESAKPMAWDNKEERGDCYGHLPATVENVDGSCLVQRSGLSPGSTAYGGQDEKTVCGEERDTGE